MKHPFYTKSNKEQQNIQIRIGLVAFTLIGLGFFIAMKTGFLIIGVLILVIVLSIIAPFFDTPSLKKTGQLIYHSTMLLSEKSKNGTIKIHGGTLLDYVFVIDRNLSGKQRTAFILQQYLEGILHLIETNKDYKDLKVKGTSYIISERTAQKLGFNTSSTDYIQIFMLSFNYLNLLASNSISKGKIAFPNLRRTCTFETTIGAIEKNKSYISSLNKSLKNKLNGI
ncbi:MAG: hypothetical protein JXQ87_17985 [Bacteroidia bacterium]